MAYSKSAFRVTVSILTCLSLCSTDTTSPQDKNMDDTIVSDIMQYVQPYFKTFQIGKASFYPRTNDNNIIQAIEAKIKELKPFFEDGGRTDNTIDRETDDNLELEGTDETTIVEFVPKLQNNFNVNSSNILRDTQNASEPDSFHTSIRKYKKMRNKIKLALEKETVSKKTKNMVVRAVDDMIAKLVESKCPWNNDTAKSLRSLTMFNDLYFIDNKTCYVHNVLMSEEDCLKLKENITHIMQKVSESFLTTGSTINEFFSKFVHNISLNPFFDMFSKTVTNIFRDSQTINDKYKVRCSVIDMEKTNNRYGYSRRSNCDDFRLCSDEFRGYLLDFYKSLNDTAVSVFGNYAAMYQRDVNADESDEKHEVITTINNASEIVAGEIVKLFIRQTSKFTLEGMSKKESKITAIKEFVRRCIKNTNKRIDKHMTRFISNLRERVAQGVKKDLSVNLGVDLGNLESHFIAKICSLFVTCNGEVGRSYRKRYQNHRDNENNRVYVKVQLTLDDDLKKSLLNRHRLLLRSFKSKKPARKQYEFANKSEERVTVTRTSINGQLTTKPGRSNVTDINNVTADSVEDNSIEQNQEKEVRND